MYLLSNVFFRTNVPASHMFTTKQSEKVMYLLSNVFLRMIMSTVSIGSGNI